MSEPLRSDAWHCNNLVLLVARLVQHVRKNDPQNDVAEKAMDYMRRHNLTPTILRGIKEHLGLPNE